MQYANRICLILFYAINFAEIWLKYITCNKFCQYLICGMEMLLEGSTGECLQAAAQWLMLELVDLAVEHIDLHAETINRIHAVRFMTAAEPFIYFDCVIIELSS